MGGSVSSFETSREVPAAIENIIRLQDEIQSHQPMPLMYWKAVDLVLMACWLQGEPIWSRASHTGGTSVTTRRWHAAEYVSVQSPRAMQYVESEELALRVLVSLGSRVGRYLERPKHWDHEYKQGELIATSLRLSDFDIASQALLREVFELPDDFDADLVRTDSVERNPVVVDDRFYRNKFVPLGNRAFTC